MKSNKGPASPQHCYKHSNGELCNHSRQILEHSSPFRAPLLKPRDRPLQSRQKEECSTSFRSELRCHKHYSRTGPSKGFGIFLATIACLSDWYEEKKSLKGLVMIDVDRVKDQIVDHLNVFVYAVVDSFSLHVIIPELIDNR